MQIFNLLNCRKIDATLNVFEGILNNSIFVFVWIGIFGMQILLGQYGGVFFSVFSEGLNGLSWGIVIAWGASTMPISFIIKLLIFYVFKMGDGADDLEEEEVEEEGHEQQHEFHPHHIKDRITQAILQKLKFSKDPLVEQR